ncbi:MAG: adenylate kinase [Halobacteriovoraceae bacterium]|jgi:adenylate kinase family enzyme|nr:adenylate kinase [Halobacteriovoraceae bacterium]MBT5094090.1 adenylate kinase [Halobacteriovoraceae bacterium]
MKKPQRIAIIGSSCTGKTTLAKELSKRLKIPHQELDQFNWQENWSEAPLEVYRQRVDRLTSQECWVTDGNYRKSRDLVWERATTIIWLDFTLPLILSRFFSRSIRRSFSKVELWNGNRETLWNSILRRESLLAWILKVYEPNRKSFSALMKDPKYGAQNFIHFDHPYQLEKFLQSIGHSQLET